MEIAEKKVVETTTQEINRLFELQRAYQYEYGRKSISVRFDRLKKLKKAIEKFRGEIRTAVHNDFNKHATEVDSTEILPSIIEIKYAMQHLNAWTKDKKVTTPMALFGTSSKIIHEPKGASLIIAPWNFPFLLTIAPLVGAIAAGCPVILKPSENTGHTSEILAKLVNETFDEKEVALVQGGVQTSTDLLNLPFNHIYFTGSPAVGKIVMKAASKHLASVTLELGGKSPVIVDKTANLKKAAARIVWGKLMNAGQICIAPDYLIVHKDVKEKLISLMKEQIETYYTADAKSSDSYARIVNSRNFARIDGLLKDAVEKGGKFEYGGNVDASENYIEPTIISDLSDDSKLMQEEIFGPVLPIVTFTNLKEVPEIVQSKEKALALYIFSSSRKNTNYLLKNTTAGGSAINHCIIHNVNPNLPFGGVNNSGIGKGLGHHGFLGFTNERGVLKQTSPLSTSDLLAPPYTPFKSWLVKITEKWMT